VNSSHGSVIGPQLVGEASIPEIWRASRLSSSWTRIRAAAPERTFDDAHVLVEYQMMDICAVEQRTDG